MEPLDLDLVKRLDIASALADELSTRRNFTPDVSALSDAQHNLGSFVRQLKSALRDGLQVAPADIVDAHKHGHGARPISILGLNEQVLLRALTDLVLADTELFDRSHNAYRSFIEGPVDHARALAPPSNLFGRLYGEGVSHVVKTDITAFYQYVDHARLRSELIRISMEFDAIEALIELLSDIKGRGFGLPQIYLAADRLSEVYIEILERRLHRSGLHVWRFNDDFRIACENYDGVLLALEHLHREARELGLVLNQGKTTTPRYATYFEEVTGAVFPSDGEAVGQLSDPAELLTDYDAGDLANPLEAVEILNSVGHKDGLTPRDLTQADVRRLRRSLRTLTGQAEEANGQSLVELMRFAQALTPEVVEYLTALGQSTDTKQVAIHVVDEVVSRVHLSSWQIIWWIHLATELKLLADASGERENRVAWMDAKARSDVESVRAFAVRALADAGLTDLKTVDAAYSRSHAAWQPLLLRAIRALRDIDGEAIPSKAWKALRSEPVPAKWILQ